MKIKDMDWKWFLKLKKEDLRIGIEIDGGTIRIAQLGCFKDRLKPMKYVEAYSIEELDDEELSSKIKALILENNLKFNHVITSIPRYLTTVRYVNLPSTDRLEIENMIKYEAGEMVPYPTDELVVDYQVVSTNDEGYSKVMVIIVHQDIVMKRLSVLKKTGIEPDIIDLGSIALFNWFKSIRKDKKSFSVIVNIGRSDTDIVIIDNGELVFSRGLTTGLNPLFKTIMDKLNVPLEVIIRDINQLKFSPPYEKIIGEFTKEWKNRLLEEVNNSLDNYRRESGKETLPDEMLITGHGAKMEWFVDSLKKRVQVEFLDSFYGERIDPGFIVTFGSVMPVKRYTVNLLPSLIKYKRARVLRRKNLVSVGSLIGVIIVLLFSILIVRFEQRVYYIGLLDEEIKRITPLSKRVQQMGTELRIIKEELPSNVSAIELLSELYKIVPQGIYFNRIRFDMGKMVLIHGQSEKLTDVFDLVGLLNDSQYLSNGKVRYTVKRKTVDKEVIDFEVEGHFR